MTLSLPCILGAVLVAPALWAQPACASKGDSTRTSLEGVVAVVSTTSITWYDVCDRLDQKLQQRQRVTAPTGDELRAAIDATLRDVVDEALILVKAGNLGIVVPDTQIISEGRERFREMRSKFATQADFERHLALAGRGTPDEYQRYLNENLRRQKTFVAAVRKLSADTTVIPPNATSLEQARAMRRYLDRLRTEVIVAVYPDRAYAFAGIR